MEPKHTNDDRENHCLDMVSLQQDDDPDAEGTNSLETQKAHPTGEFVIVA